VGDGSAAPAAPVPTGRTVFLRPSGRWPKLDFAELFAYRGLFFFLVWRDVKVRYAQTVLGAGWAVLQPVLMMVIFTVIFGHLAQLPSDGAPYALFSLAALVPWTYFSTALAGASNSLVADQRLITKVYFPRLVIPFAPVLAGLVDFGIAFVILLLLMAAFGVVPAPAALVLLPLLVLSMMMTAAGIGCWLAALNVQYRDIRYAVPFLVQALMYASPIVYPMSLIPERFQPLYALNPMAGVIEGFRSVLLSTGAVPWSMVALSMLSGLVFFVVGVTYFRGMERVFADVA
jgi:lipopolysaccharide transport system permease protein